MTSHETALILHRSVSAFAVQPSFIMDVRVLTHSFSVCTGQAIHKLDEVTTFRCFYISATFNSAQKIFFAAQKIVACL